MLQYGKPMIRYASAILKDGELAKKVVQECFLGLLDEPDGTVHLHLQGWLFRQCRNRAIDAWRRRRQEAIEGVDELPDFSLDPLQRLEENRILVLLQGEIQKLSGRHQEVLWLKYHEGLSYKQIAEIMDFSSSNVGFLLFQALQQLRDSSILSDTSKMTVSARATEVAAKASIPLTLRNRNVNGE